MVWTAHCTHVRASARFAASSPPQRWPSASAVPRRYAVPRAARGRPRDARQAIQSNVSFVHMCGHVLYLLILITTLPHTTYIHIYYNNMLCIPLTSIHILKQKKSCVLWLLCGVWCVWAFLTWRVPTDRWYRSTPHGRRWCGSMPACQALQDIHPSLAHRHPMTTNDNIRYVCQIPAAQRAP